MSSKNIKVSVIIPTYKRNEILIDSIKSVLSQKFESFELIIVDQSLEHDPSTNRYLENLADSRVKYFKVSPPSLPAARNFGVKNSQGEVVIFIDDDVILDENFIKAHFTSYQEEGVLAVAGRIREIGKKPGETLHYIRKTGFGAGSFDYPNAGFVDTPRGCNMSFKKAVLQKIGGFDTNYIGNALNEESDVAFRLRKIGIKTFYNPQASLLHLLTPTGGCREDKPTFENYIHFRNEMLFFLKNRPLVYFPYFFGGRFFKYVFNRNLLKSGKIFNRLWVFSKGLTLGTWSYLFPNKQIVAREL